MTVERERQIVLDTETTGLEVGQGHRVIEIGCIELVKRRFTRTGEWNGALVFDDYGHHPVEIAAVLKAAKGLMLGGAALAALGGRSRAAGVVGGIAPDARSRLIRA